MKTAVKRPGSATITFPSDTQMQITREFDAPARLLFKAWTTPEHVRRWWGFPSAEWKVCEVDLRVGGGWRWVVEEGGMEVAFHGTYKEIVEPTRLVYTEVFEGAPVPDPDAIAVLNTTTFEERDGTTTMTTLTECYSQETRDAMLASGMESGMQVSYDRMEELVHELAA